MLFGSGREQEDSMLLDGDEITIAELVTCVHVPVMVHWSGQGTISCV